MELLPDELKPIWKDFISGSEKNIGKVRTVIRESWLRCKKAGVNPYQKLVENIINTDSLKSIKQKNEYWLEIARPVMQTLYNFVMSSGFIISISDNNGILLEMIGDSDIVKDIANGNFIPGADWSEISAGTNGIGTVLITNKPLQIFSFEHYCICSHKWTCSAAPIHDPDGRIIGVLDMTGRYENVHPHTLGMVVAGADAVERQITMQKIWLERNRTNRLCEALMESISEGIIATNADGKIIHINQVAAQMLRVQAESEIGKDINEVFKCNGKDCKSILDKSKYITDEEIDISNEHSSTKAVVTTRPIRDNEGHHEGNVMIVNKISRARQLAQRMSGATAKVTFEDLLGNSPKFKECLHIANIAASSDSTVLLLGESGTGKDVLAQAIHNASCRAKGPFVVLNCGAVPKDLIGSELFGYVEGAFTGARRGGNPGKFELAETGTIFLDEIGDMPPELQSNLLRVIEQKTITRIGGNSVIPVNVRIIAATNRDLIKEVKLGNFREDLFFRLNVITINLVPLRERLEDLELLFLHFLKKKEKQMGKKICEIDERIWNILKCHSWPGNVRELQNVVERAINMCDGSKLKLEHLPAYLSERTNASLNKENSEPIAIYEKQLILKLLKNKNGNISQVAKELGVARSTLYRKISKYGLIEEKKMYREL